MFEESVRSQYGVVPPNEEPGVGSQESEDGLPRRGVLAGIAALALVGPLGVAQAQHVHQSIPQVDLGPYKAKGVYLSRIRDVGIAL